MALLSDSCCSTCKGPYGICRNRGCWHHIETRRRQDADDVSRRLHRDPTGDQAVNNIMRSRKPKAPRPGPFSYPKEGR